MPYNYPGKICPFCGSKNIENNTIGLNNKESEFYFPEMDDVISKYEEAGIEMPRSSEADDLCGPPNHLEDCVNCSYKDCEFMNECINEIWDVDEVRIDNDTIDHMRKNVVMPSPLSFDDLDINEFVLLGLDPLPDGNKKLVTKTYYTDMNYRFLHTFVDADFVPA